MASDLGIGYTNYNKLENGNREPSVKELQLLAKLFDMTVDQILNYEGELPKEVTLEDKPEFERIKLINQLDEEEKNALIKIINSMLTKKRMKDLLDGKANF